MLSENLGDFSGWAGCFGRVVKSRNKRRAARGGGWFGWSMTSNEARRLFSEVAGIVGMGGEERGRVWCDSSSGQLALLTRVTHATLFFLATLQLRRRRASDLLQSLLIIPSWKIRESLVVSRFRFQTLPLLYSSTYLLSSFRSVFRSRASLRVWREEWFELGLGFEVVGVAGISRASLIRM